MVDCIMFVFAVSNLWASQGYTIVELRSKTDSTAQYA